MILDFELYFIWDTVLISWQLQDNQEPWTKMATMYYRVKVQYLD